MISYFYLKGDVMRKYCSLLFIAILISLFAMNLADSSTIVVSKEGSAFSSIQEAVDSAKSGDIIEVQNGSYYENVRIDKELIIQGMPNSIIDGYGEGVAFALRAYNITINGFTIQNHGTGILIASHGKRNTLSNNIIRNNRAGIILDIYSSDNVLVSNDIYNNSNNFLTLPSYVCDWSIEPSSFMAIGSENDINESNILDGKPIYYLINQTGRVINASSNASMIYCFNCSNITISDLTIQNNTCAIYFFKTRNSMIKNVTATNNTHGIVLVYSSNNIISNNTIYNNKNNGIKMEFSGNNILSGNIISGNMQNFGAEGYNSVDATNLIEGKPIYYLVRASNRSINETSNAGAVYCVDCTNIEIENLSLKNLTHGIYFYNTTNSTVKNNMFINNWFGVFLDRSDNNTIFNNTFPFNWVRAIALIHSNSNLIKECKIIGISEEEYNGCNSPAFFTNITNVGDNVFEMNNFEVESRYSGMDWCPDCSAEPHLYLPVKTEPQGASIWLDGFDTGFVSNHELLFKDVNNHSIELVLEGYKKEKIGFNIHDLYTNRARSMDLIMLKKE